MKRIAVKIGTAALGVLIVLAVWTFTGRNKSISTGSNTKIPAKIFGGGGRHVTIEVEVNGPAQLGFMGTLPRKPSGDQPLEEDSENISPGTHSWVVELAPHTSGTFDLRALNPQVGNKLSWVVKVDGKEIANESDSLDKPLQAGYAQDLQTRVEGEEEEQPASDNE